MTKVGALGVRRRRARACRDVIRSRLVAISQNQGRLARVRPALERGFRLIVLNSRGEPVCRASMLFRVNAPRVCPAVGGLANGSVKVG
jgi:hypothetical protein